MEQGKSSRLDGFDSLPDRVAGLVGIGELRDSGRWFAMKSRFPRQMQEVYISSASIQPCFECV